MRLADNNDLTFHEVQLLANCSQPVFVLEISSLMDGLVLRGFVRLFPAICEHSNRECFLLITTDQGALYVEDWIGRHGNDAGDGYHIPSGSDSIAVA